MSNYIDQQQAIAREYYGRDASPDELATEFAKNDLPIRSQQFSQIREDLPDNLSPRKAAERLQIIRALDGVHSRLREIGK